MVRSEARIPTLSADRYAKQLTSHATHMGAHSEWTPPNGVVEFPQGGTCRIKADSDVLRLVAEASTATQLAAIQAIVTADLERFGNRQGMKVLWTS